MNNKCTYLLEISSETSRRWVIFAVTLSHDTSSPFLSQIVLMMRCSVSRASNYDLLICASIWSGTVIVGINNHAIIVIVSTTCIRLANGTWEYCLLAVDSVLMCIHMAVRRAISNWAWVIALPALRRNSFTVRCVATACSEGVWILALHEINCRVMLLRMNWVRSCVSLICLIRESRRIKREATLIRLIHPERIVVSLIEVNLLSLI